MAKIEVRCASGHDEDLADGRVAVFGGDPVKSVDDTHPHNKRLLEEGRIVQVAKRSSASSSSSTSGGDS